MPLELILKKPLRPSIRNTLREATRNIYRFDGFDDYAVLAYRAINPDGDIDIQFKTGPWVPTIPTGTEYTVISQCMSSTFNNKEFRLYFNASQGALQLQLGGTAYSGTGNPVLLAPSTKYRVILQDTVLKIFINDTLISEQVFSRGAAREPLAQTVIGADTHGSATTFRAPALGSFYDININGFAYPLSDRGQQIQLPHPNNMGQELITRAVLEAPAVKDSQWTYLGGGRWQYLGDGSLNVLQFLTVNSQPEFGYVEFEVEYYSGTGTMTCSVSNPSQSSFSSIGLKRYFFITKRDSNQNTFQFKRLTGSVSCIIKNISFKPLSIQETEVLFNPTFSNNGQGWIKDKIAITQTGNNIRLTNTDSAYAGAAMQTFQTVPNKVYLLSFTIPSGIQTSIRASINDGGIGAYTGNIFFNTYYNFSGQNISAIFKAKSGSATIRILCNGGSAGDWTEFTSLQIKPIDSVCNPMTILNKSNIWWGSLGNLVREVYIFDGVDDYGILPYRVINPEGDIDIEWEQGEVPTTASRCIVSQCENGSITNREFFLRWNVGNLELLVGGNTICYEPFTGSLAGKWRITYSGTVVTIFRNDQEVFNALTRTRGTAREYFAATRIGVRSNAGTLGEHFLGALYNIKINGIIYKLGTKNSQVQLPTPTLLGQEIFNKDTATASGSITVETDHFSFAVTAGESTIIRTPSNSLLPNTDYIIELEVFDHVAGNIANNTNGFTNISNSTNGRFKQVFNTGPSTRLTLGRSGTVCNLKVRNISIKQLGVAGSTDLVINGGFSSGTQNWAALYGASLSIVSGKAVASYQAGQAGRVEQSITLEKDSYYWISADVSSISGVSNARVMLIRGAAGNYSSLGQQELSTTGKINFVVLAPASDAIISLRTSDISNSGTVEWDNISIRKLDSLCNPIQLINTTSDRWREIDDV